MNTKDTDTAQSGRSLAATPLFAETLTIRVGSRGRHLRLPLGAVMVHGLMREGDLVANVVKVCWEPIDAEDVGQPNDIYDAVCRPARGFDT